MSDAVVFEMVEETAIVTLNNPDVRNALSVEMAEQLQEALDQLQEEEARCLVVQGSGGTFCAGGDIEAMLEGVADDVDIETRIQEFALPVNRAVQAVYECSVPTIAKVDGPAFGAGAALAIACDVVLASERSKIGFGFRQVGLSVDSGTSYLLPRIVGENVAKELVYTGELLDNERAKDLGLFNRVFPTDEFEQRTQRVVERVANGPTLALEESKRLIEDGRSRSFSEAVDAETAALRQALVSADHAEGVRAFAEERDPDFEGW